ncbi:hypothetical protein KPSA1B_102870 [Pseudomonas syringae pv. actinidiae]|nr:hypothetical protein KPSA1B_102870 [Pseudomonas syringae pv. actinidiae]
MEMQYIHGSRSLMQVINVLSDHGDAIPRFSESAHRKMCSIAPGVRIVVASPVFPKKA